MKKLIRRIGRFLKSLLWPYVFSYLYFTSVLYLFGHASGNLELETIWGLPILLSLLGVVAYIPLRFLPTGPVGTVFVAPVFSVFCVLVVLTSDKASSDAPGIALLAAFLGICLGFFEISRRGVSRGSSDHGSLEDQEEEAVDWRY